MLDSIPHRRVALPVWNRESALERRQAAPVSGCPKRSSVVPKGDRPPATVPPWRSGNASTSQDAPSARSLVRAHRAVHQSERIGEGTSRRPFPGAGLAHGQGSARRSARRAARNVVASRNDGRTTRSGSRSRATRAEHGFGSCRAVRSAGQAARVAEAALAPTAPERSDLRPHWNAKTTRGTPHQLSRALGAGPSPRVERRDQAA